MNRLNNGPVLKVESEAERAVIGALLMSGTNGDATCPVTVFGELAVRDLVDDQLRSLFAAAKRLHERGEPLENMLWLQEVECDLSRDEAVMLLLECREAVATTATVGSYVRLVGNASRQRRLACAANDALNAARSARTAGDVDDVTAMLRMSLDALDGPHPTERAPVAIEAGQPFPVAALPGVVGEYVCAAAAAIGCDPSYIALPLLGCMARAIGNKRVIRLKRTWTEPAIIWAAIIGKSGTHKTPALQAAMRFLDRSQAASIIAHIEALATFEQEKACYDRDYAAWKRLKNTTEPPPWAPVEPVCVRYVTTDTTIEALVAMLAAQFDGLLVSRDELAGWLGGIAEYKGGRGSDLGHWLACWSAVPLTIDRKTGAVKMLHIPRAAVSIVGGIQPGVLRTAIGQEHMQDGLCARLLMAMPEPRQVKWSEAIVDPPTEAAMQGVFDRLLALEPAADEEGHPAPFALPFTPEAKKVWVAYYDRHRAELVELDDDLAAAWSKLEAYTARFALIFQLCAWAAGEASGEAVDQSSVEAAIMLSDWFGSEARRVYGLFSEAAADREERELVELVDRKGGSLTARELMRSSRRYPTSADAEAALNQLARSGRGRWEPMPAGPRGGKPTRVFRTVDTVDVDETPENTGNGELLSTSAASALQNGHDPEAVNRLLGEPERGGP